MPSAADGFSAWSSVRGELERALAAVPREPVDALVARLRHSPGRLFFSGQGRSGLLAQMAAMRFMHLGLATHAVGESTAPAVGPGDTLLVISGSGRTATVVEHARVAAAVGATVLLVTQRSTGPVHDIAHETLIIEVGESVQFGNTLFEHVALVLLDSVALALMGEVEDAAAQMHRRHTNLQ